MQTLITEGTIVTCDTKHSVLQGDVLVRDGRVVAIGKVSSRELDAGGSLTRIIDASRCAVLPGFIQAHVHLCQALFRGAADDMPLLDWLKKRIWPFEAGHNEKSLRTSAELGLHEMMCAGTTTILDMGTVHHHDVVMEACLRSGIRAISGKTMMDAGGDVPRGLKETTKESLRETERLFRAWHGKGDGRLRYAVSPRFILSCTENLFRQGAQFARDNGLLFHTHAAEHAEERKAVRAVLGDDDIATLVRWKAVGPNSVFAHGVQLTNEEADVLAERGASVVHCPSANLKLGSGIARIAELDERGVKLALGADGAPCNNNLDPWIELRSAALLSKVRSDVTSFPAKRALRLLTSDGARALGLQDEIGTIQVGKRADLQVVDLQGTHAQPGGDVFSRLVYACKSSDVRTVMVDGQVVVFEREHRRFDKQELVASASKQLKALEQRA